MSLTTGSVIFYLGYIISGNWGRDPAVTNTREKEKTKKDK